jgi:DNA-binding MarR family transcriptional regulator
MHLPPPTVTYLVKQLEAKGFLERRAEAATSKFRLVQTALGSDALCRGREVLNRPLGERLGRLSPRRWHRDRPAPPQLAGRKDRDDLG